MIAPRPSERDAVAVAKVLRRQRVPSADLAALYVRALHEGEGLTLGQLAVLTGTERSTVTKWMRGECVPRSRKVRQALLWRARLGATATAQLDEGRAQDLKHAQAIHEATEGLSARGVLEHAAERAGARLEDLGRRRQTAACLNARRLTALVLVLHRGMTQARAARVLQLSQSRVSRIVSGWPE